MANKYAKQSIVLFASSALSVLLGIGTSVLNTSLLSPSDYGDFRYVTNLLNFFASLLLFGCFVSGSRCLALSIDKEHSRKIRGVMVIILAITTLVMMLCMLGCYVFHKGNINSSVAPLFIFALPICGAPLFLNYINTVFQGDNSIYKLSLARLLPSAVYLIVAWVLFSNITASSSKVLLLQNGVTVLILLVLIISTKPSFRNINAAYEELKRENKAYGFNVYIGSIAGVSLGYLAGITLGLFSDDNINVGYYTLALTIATPLSILPTVIGTTYFKKFATQDYIDKKVLQVTLGISIGCLVIYNLLITPIVNLLYDESYAQVAVYAQYLAIGTTIHGLGDMFNRFLGSHGKGKELRNGAFLCGITMVVGNTLLVYIFDIGGAVGTRILASLAYCGAMVYYYRKFRKEHINESVYPN